MQLARCRNLMVAAMLLTGIAIPSSAQAGLIPWAYNAIFGPSQMYGYGAPGYGYSVGYPRTMTMSSYYSPAWGAYTAGYAPSFGYDAFGGGLGTYGYASPCAPCGCNPCGTCAGGCASGNCINGNCINGNCASGNCGAGYAPDIQNGPTPEPTQANPNPPEAKPPVNSNPPVNPNTTPPIDDFTRVPPRTNDTTIPSTIPQTNPNSSTIPDRSIPNAVPETNNTPSAPPFNSNSGTDGLFERPMLDRTPAPIEPGNPGQATPNSTDVLPLGTEVLPAPLEMESIPLASIQVERQRVVMQAGYHASAPGRLVVRPRLTPVQELAHK